MPTGEQMSIYDAAMRYQEAGTPLVILAGKEYGAGSSRDPRIQNNVFNELFEVFLSNNYFSVFSVDSVAIKIGFQEPAASYRS